MVIMKKIWREGVLVTRVWPPLRCGGKMGEKEKGHQNFWRIENIFLNEVKNLKDKVPEFCQKFNPPPS